MLCSAIATWPLGEIDRATSLFGRAQIRMAAVTHANARALGRQMSALFDVMRRDPMSASRNASELAQLAREHDLTMFQAFAVFLEGWAAVSRGEPAGLDGMRRGVDLLREQNVLMFDGLLKIVLAETEAAAGDVDRALAVLDEALATVERIGYRAFEAELHRVRGEMLLKRDPADFAEGEQALQTAVAIARQQGTRAFELRAALSLADLCKSTSRPAEAHALLAAALEGFSPTPDLLELAEAQALLTALTETDEVKAAEAQRQRRQHLHVAYGNALIAARGYGAPETTQAFAKAREVAREGSTSERLAADFGLWVGSLLRGELDQMRALGASFLADANAVPNSPEVGVAERITGITHWYAGSFREARPHHERALALFQPGRDDDLAFRFAHDLGVGAMANAAICFWILGEVDRAVDLMNRTVTRYGRLAHVPTRALGNLLAAVFYLMRGDRGRAAAHGAELSDLAQQHDLAMWRAYAAFFDWGDQPDAGARASGTMRRGLELLRAQNVYLYDGLLKSALAAKEAEAGRLESAIEIVDEALATSARIGHQSFDVELHRLRGEVLAKSEPTDPASAAEAFQTALAVAKQQGSRSFGLRAALSLAKLYQSTARPADAHALLAPALEGFSPTPEMPEIAEAQALLAALAETEEVKADAARRQRQAQLQVAYGNALIAARGFGAPETTEAFTRVREAPYAEKDSPERLAADFGLWAGSYTRGELQSMRTHAAAFLADIEGRPDSPEAGVAHRAQGITHWFAGEFRPAREHLERALALFQSGRDDDLAYRFGMDPGVPPMAYLGFTLWVLGEPKRAVSFIERARERVTSLTHAHTLALGTMHAAFFELMRGDRSRARTDASNLSRILREHDLRLFRAFGEFLEGWLTADGGALADGLKGMRRGAENLRDQNAAVLDGLIKIVLAQIEARAGHPERALADLDDALATAERLGFRTFEAELHRARGELMLGRDADSLELAERAFQTAIAVAHEQDARSFELRAALSLAKLYQSTGRPVEAQAVLEPALEGFSPTPEMPEIAEAQALFVAIEAGADVRPE